MAGTTSAAGIRPFSADCSGVVRFSQLDDCSAEEGELSSGVSTGEASPEILAFFQDCSKQLDAHHDRHERLVKISRDITVESKRVIFLLHRIHNEASQEKISAEARTKLQWVTATLFKKVAQELNGQDPQRYLRAYTAGLQEFIEAASLLHYIETGSLLTHDEVQKQLTFGDDLQVLAPVYEYLLGIADLTGELMRMCINAVGRGAVGTCFLACSFLRKLHEALSSLNLGQQRELKRKLQVSRQSLQKVETACYNVQVRGSEVPKESLKLLASQAVHMDDHSGWNEEFDQ